MVRDQTEFGLAPAGGSSNFTCGATVPAMTGTDGNGLKYGGNTCADWTASAGQNHALGDTDATGQDWTELGVLERLQSDGADLLHRAVAIRSRARAGRTRWRRLRRV
ncbi:MAG TPA: hypothetical protein VK550_18515 [Polyangiaceae bacterium]|nr:hypothetical protein [Polyangiaceae bacterium]